MVFESDARDNQTALVASEAAIASNLVHRHIVATYWHDVRTVSDARGLELGIFKLCLVQVRPLYRCRNAHCPMLAMRADLIPDAGAQSSALYALAMARRPQSLTLHASLSCIHWSPLSAPQQACVVEPASPPFALL